MIADQALTIREFCQTYKISRATLYRLKKLGRAPMMTRIGRKVLIRVDVAAAWHRQFDEHQPPAAA